MSIENVPEKCRLCPYILPIIQTIVTLETKQVTPDEARKLLNDEFSIEEIRAAAAKLQNDLRAANAQLDGERARTVGCAGVSLDNVVPGATSLSGLCQSIFTRIGPNKISD